MTIEASSASARRWPVAAVLAAVLCAVLCGAGKSEAAQLETKVLAAPKALAPFRLADHDGVPFSNERLTGRWSLMMLGFTHCPDVCPFTLQNLALVLEQMSTRVAPERLPQVVFVAVDPERDRPVLADYVRYFNDGFIGITGAPADVKVLIDGLEGYVRFVGMEADKASYQVQHSAVVSFVDPQARIRATLNPPMEPGAAADFLADLMRRVAPDIK
jgi:protein SCO1/2